MATTLAPGRAGGNRPSGPSLQGRRVVDAADGVPFAVPVTEATEAVIFNGVPLLAARRRLRGGDRRGPAAALARPRAGRIRSTGRRCSSSPAIAVAAGDLRRARRCTTAGRSAGTSGSRSPPCSLALAAGAAAARALARPRVRRRRDRAPQEAEERVSARDRELERRRRAVEGARRARTIGGRRRAAARAAGDRRCSAVGFAGVVARHARTAVGARRLRRARTDARPRGGGRCDVDLRNEPSGIASAVFDAAPVTVFDVTSSPLVSPRLVRAGRCAERRVDPDDRRGARDRRAVVAATDAKRAFPTEELALLQAVAAEAALALDRLRSAVRALRALEREQRSRTIDAAHSRRARAGRGRSPSRAPSSHVLQLDRAEVVLGPAASESPDRRRRRAHRLSDRRARDAARRRRAFLVDTVAARGRFGAAARRGSLAENERRLEQQAALLHAAQVVTSELEIETVLERLVEEVTKLLGGRRGRLLPARSRARRAALRRGARVRPGRSSASSSRPSRASPARRSQRRGRSRPRTTSRSRRRSRIRRTHGFSRALVAPMVWAGETRGVLGVGIRDGDAHVRRLRRRAARGVRVARLARACATPRASPSASRQARVQRGFYRIASLLGEPLSLAETYDAAAQAAAEALGGDFAAVLVQTAVGLGGRRRPRAARRGARAGAPARARRGRRRRTGARRERGSPTTSASTTAWRERAVRVAARDPGAGETAGLVLVFFDERARRSRARTSSSRSRSPARRAARSTAAGSSRRSARARSLSQQLARTGSLLATELDPVAVLEAVVERGGRACSARTRRRSRRSRGTSSSSPPRSARERRSRSAPARRRPAGSPATSSSRARRSRTRTPRRTTALAESDALLAFGHRAYLGVPLAGA